MKQLPMDAYAIHKGQTTLNGGVQASGTNAFCIGANQVATADRCIQYGRISMNLPHHRRYNWHMMFRRYRTPVTALLVIAIVAALITLLALTTDALATSNETLADKREVIRQFDAVVTGVAVMHGDGWKLERVTQRQLVDGIK